MPEWISPKKEQPKESGWYLVAFWHENDLFKEGGFWTHQVIQYNTEATGWNTSPGDENRARHEMFPKFWMPVPDMPAEEVLPNES